MQNLYERIAYLGGMIKLANIELLGGSPQSTGVSIQRLKNGRTMNAGKPNAAGYSPTKGAVKPKFTSEMKENSPYNLR